MTQGRVIVPERTAAAVHAGQPALFVDEHGRLERVLVTSNVWPHPDSAEPMRTCSFLDRAGEEYEVKAANLAPCDESFRLVPAAPATLQPGDRRWDIPYTPAPVQRSPVMDKFDRVHVVRPRGVALDIPRMTPSQLERLEAADALQAKADGRKAARAIVVKGRVVGWDRMGKVEAQERREARAAYEALQQETAAANDRDSLKRSRAELIALEALRGIEYRPNGAGLSRKNGLDTLLLSGSLTSPEHTAGEKYAEMFGAAFPDPSCRIANLGGMAGGRDADAEQQRRDAQTKAREALEKLEDVIRETVTHPRAIPILRLVAGQGRILSHVVTGGANRAAHARHLKAALSVLAERWGLQ